MRIGPASCVAIFLSLPGSPCSGQSGMSLVGAGYSNPFPLIVAPGQIVTFFVSGVRTILPPGSLVQRAARTPLPSSLAGFSATISQQQTIQALPLIQVRQVDNCPDPRALSPDCVSTALTVQIPNDLFVTDNPLILGTTFPDSATVTISDGTGASQAFRLLLSRQNFHILTTCDSVLPVPNPFDTTTACSFFVTHQNGKFVSNLDPARPGEQLVMYALGLGKTSPAVPAGQPSPSPAATAIGDFRLLFTFAGGMSAPLQTSPSSLPSPSFVGLTPGEVGLYQVNFEAPTPNGSVSGCDGPGFSNLTIVLRNIKFPLRSVDEAQICVVAAN